MDDEHEGGADSQPGHLVDHYHPYYHLNQYQSRERMRSDEYASCRWHDIKDHDVRGDQLKSPRIVVGKGDVLHCITRRLRTSRK